MVEFGYAEMNALAKMTQGPEDSDDGEHVFGSALDPSSLHTSKKKEEIAKPHA